MIFSCFSIMKESKDTAFNWKIKLNITGGILMRMVEVVKDIIIGAGSCGIGYLIMNFKISYVAV